MDRFCILGQALRARYEQRHYEIWLRQTTYHPDSAVINGNDIELQPVPYPEHLHREYGPRGRLGLGNDDVRQDEASRQRSRNESLAMLEGAHVRSIGGDPAYWLDALVATSEAPEQRTEKPHPHSFNGWTMPRAVPKGPTGSHS